MYVLVAVLCAAMAVFISSCFVYASKFRRQKYPVHTTSLSPPDVQHQQQHPGQHQHCQESHPKTGSVQNAHDWIWLGNKSTLDHPTSDSESGKNYHQHHQRFSSSEVNVISNPLRTVVSDDLHQAERIPLKDLHTSSRSTTAAYTASEIGPHQQQQPLYPQRHFVSEQHLRGIPTYLSI